MPLIILDASVYAPLIVLCGRALPTVLREIRAIILDLTIYEVCNAFWKECVKLGRIDRERAKLACIVSKELSRYVVLFRIDNLNLEEIMDIAIANNITFYDASYIALARKLNASIATEDSDIISAAPRYGIKVVRLNNLTELCREHSTSSDSQIHQHPSSKCHNSS